MSNYIIKHVTHPSSLTTIVSKAIWTIDNLLDWKAYLFAFHSVTTLNISNCCMSVAGTTMSLVSYRWKNSLISPINLNKSSEVKRFHKCWCFWLWSPHQFVKFNFNRFKENSLYLWKRFIGKSRVKGHFVLAVGFRVMWIDKFRIIFFDKFPVLRLIPVSWNWKLILLCFYSFRGNLRDK